jgi:hypothetical protein
MGDITKEYAFIIEADLPRRVAELFSFAFHGMPLKDMGAVLASGFKTRLGKCNFSIDPGYVTKRYILPMRDSEEPYLMLVMSSRNYCLKPGLGSELYFCGRRVIGGLSKWVHFHLAMIPEDKATYYQKYNEELQKNFIYFQDKRYSRNLCGIWGKWSHDDSLIGAMRAVNYISSDAITGFLNTGQAFCDLVDNTDSLKYNDLLNALCDYVSNKGNWLVLSENGVNPVKLSKEICTGLLWGNLIYQTRKIFLSTARELGYELIKTDSPNADWNFQYYTNDQIGEAIYRLKWAEAINEKTYREYKAGCLKCLTGGMRV